MKSKRLALLPLALAISSLVFSQTPHGIEVKWIASSTAGVAGYNVYRGTVSGGPYTKLTAAPLPSTALTYLDPVVDGNKYFYVATAVSQGPIVLESVFSSEISQTAPGPIPNPPTGLAASQQ